VVFSGWATSKGRGDMPTEPRKALRGRFVRRQIAQSKSVATLIKRRGPWAGLIFERLITFQDDDHRFIAEATIVKSNCIPWHDGEHSTDEVAGDLAEMHRLGMIELYESGGTLYGWFPNGDQHQPALRPDRYTPSELPVPTCPPLAAESPPVGGADVEAVVEDDVEEEVHLAPAKAAAPRKRAPRTPDAEDPKDRKLDPEQNAIKQAAVCYLDEAVKRWTRMEKPPGWSIPASAGFFRERVMAGDTLEDMQWCIDCYFRRLKKADDEAAAKGRTTTRAGSFAHFKGTYGSLCRELIAEIERRQARENQSARTASLTLRTSGDAELGEARAAEDGGA
jgi:hypothetical protein